VISALRIELTSALLIHDDAFAETLAVHFGRHLLPFTRSQ
jgi:hypothetical protein